MKFLMFSDLHYYPGVFYGDDLEITRSLIRRAKENGCEFMLHAGDLCHGPSLVPELMTLLDASPVPVYHCLGNHDTDKTSLADTLAAYHMPDGHYFFDHGEYRFIIMDPNHCYLDGKYIHYDMGNYYATPAARDATPPEQLQWMEEVIRSAPGRCVIVSHSSYEREDNAKEYREFQKIVREANEESPGKVLLVMNGHLHRDHRAIVDGVLYWDVNAVNYDWVEGGDHTGYPEELAKKWTLLNNTVAYTEPLSAVVTLEGSRIEIEGAESEMLLGVTRETIGRRRLDSAGRSVRPQIQSCKITLG